MILSEFNLLKKTWVDGEYNHVIQRYPKISCELSMDKNEKIRYLPFISRSGTKLYWTRSLYLLRYKH